MMTGPEMPQKLREHHPGILPALAAAPRKLVQNISRIRALCVARIGRTSLFFGLPVLRCMVDGQTPAGGTL